MSAIWGILTRKENGQQARFEAMTEVMQRYKIDRFETVSQNGCYFGCGHQYFTPESVYDVSPIYDSEAKLCFAADCFLYNREDVLAELGAGAAEAEKTGDAELAYRLFKKQGYDFVKQLRGSFAFAIFEESTKRLHLITDHFCKRYLAYHITEDSVTFASCYKPILVAGNHQFKLSERSIIDAFSLMTPLNFREPEITPYEGVFHLDAAKHYTINLDLGTVEKEQYWNPRKNVKKLKNCTEEQYQKLFLDTYQKVCAAHLRSRKETGIMLSGGLDSSSVLALTAPILKERGKKIYSYTSVPCEGFKPVINYSMIEDESFLIRAQQKYHSNLEPRFINAGGANCISALPKYEELYDLPVKAVVNMNNVYSMGEAAVSDDCLILLGGGNGNANVSYGYITNYVGLCLEHLKVFRAFREVNQYCNITKMSKKLMLKNFIKDLWDFAFKTPNLGQYFIKEELRKKYNLTGLMNREKREMGSTYISTEKQKRNFMFIPKQYIQKSLYYTVNSLEQGILQLDPTLSVEMVELCMRLPNECFVKNGVERRLVRDYMKDLLPPVITDMKKGYGVQSSDFYYRINRDWDELKADVMELLNDPKVLKYMDREEINELIADIQAAEHNFGWNTAWFTANICSLGYFLRGHERYL